MKQSLSLLGTYLGIVVVLQAVAVVLTQLISLIAPAASLFVFLALFAAVFAVSWPVAVRINFRLVPETAEERAERKGSGRPAPGATGTVARSSAL